MNIQNIISNLSKERVSFLSDITNSVDVDKSKKYSYLRIRNMDMDPIENIIENFSEQDTYLIDPYITVEPTYNFPFLSLSRQFLIGHASNPKVIHDFLFMQLDSASESFEFDYRNYNFYLILKHKKVYLNYKEY